jgi:hypothetical protein
MVRDQPGGWHVSRMIKAKPVVKQGRKTASLEKWFCQDSRVANYDNL